MFGNALYLTSHFGIDVPAYHGADKPLSMERHASPVFVHETDGLSDAGMTCDFEGGPAFGQAADRIVGLLRQHPNQVTLLAVGPPTNIALARERAPYIAGLVKEIVVMGGAFGTMRPSVSAFR